MKTIEIESLKQTLAKKLMPLTVKASFSSSEEAPSSLQIDIYDDYNPVQHPRHADVTTPRQVAHVNAYWYGDQNYLAVESLSVQYQQLGLGKTIVRELANSLKEQGVDRIELLTEKDGVYFWPKAGFLAHDKIMNTSDMRGQSVDSFHNHDRLCEHMLISLQYRLQDIEEAWETFSPEEELHLKEIKTLFTEKYSEKDILWRVVDGAAAKHILDEEHGKFHGVLDLSNQSQLDRLHAFAPENSFKLAALFAKWQEKGVGFEAMQLFSNGVSR